jgi:hydroxymethylpyrimidine pyrophosphatase-like HAD family hydrolase
MRLAALALDYDGTIAQRDRIDSSVRDAIAAARAAGVVVLLVTGRILSELRRVAGDLHFVDGIVAENGAVIHFPANDFTTVGAPPVPAGFHAELLRRGIPAQAGQCLVDLAAEDAPQALEVIRSLELPIVLVFNRGRVMAMPQGISKATGLQMMLTTLRLSARNTVAIGDAENDHVLLRLAEVGYAVEWGAAALRAAAHHVVRGGGPAAIAPVLRARSESRRQPVLPRARRRLHVGYTPDGQEFSLAVRGRNILVAGDAKSGKSWAAGLLCEQLILHGYSVCVIDPEGDYRSLEALPGVTAIGGDDAPPTPRQLVRALRYPDRSVIVDLSRVPQTDKIDYIKSILPALNVLRRRTGLPHRILLDEAHYFLHDAGSHRLLDLEINGYLVVTYCASRLPKPLLDASEVIIVTCESNPEEIAALRRRCASCPRADAVAWSKLGELAYGQAVALPVTEEAAGQLRWFTLGQRLTPHVRHRQKYVDVPVSDSRAFVFGNLRRAQTLRQFTEVLGHAESVDGYLRRNDFSRWIADIFGDYALADDLRRIEERYQSGWDFDAAGVVVNAILSRYDLSHDSAMRTAAPERIRQSADLKNGRFTSSVAAV